MTKKRQASSSSSRPAKQTKLLFAAVQREQCPHCQQSFSSIQQLIDHVDSTHLASTAQQTQQHGCPSTPLEHADTQPSAAGGTTATLCQHQQPIHQPLQQQEQAQQQQHQQKAMQQAAWWKQAPADPVVAHIRFTRGLGPNTPPLQPVRLSTLSSVAPVELVLHALPAALANSLLTGLLAQSGGWVAGSWWFGGQQQTAPRSSATYSLDPEQAPLPAAAPEQGMPAAAAAGTQPDTLPPPPSSQPQLQLQQQGQDASTPVPLQAAGFQPGQGLTQKAPSTDLAAVPQLAAPLILQQAAELISTAVNSRMHSLGQQHWQQQRQALTAALLASAGAAHSSKDGISITAAPVQTAGILSQTVMSGYGGGPEPASRDAAVAAAVNFATASALAAPGADPPQLHVPQQPQQQQLQDIAVQWQPSYVLANLYKDGQQSVGSHADRLSTLGPLPTIASLSLGAGRVFRLHPTDASVAAAAAAGGGGSSRAAAVSSIDIQLPHNSLLIMWPPTQEQWKHEVPKTKAVTSHPLSGPARINLTFRQLHPAWAAAVPHCRCRRPAIMRCATSVGQHGGSSSLAPGGSAAAVVVSGGVGGCGSDVLQGGRFVYYYACDNTQGPGCGLYKPAVTLQAGR